ncbi:MAG: hypothetical protein M1816_002931 [Peltula sp. TS41687]|nr:MAG: hypothetical protein M1816_002931 [Peltula sp. TS41687]
MDYISIVSVYAAAFDFLAHEVTLILDYQEICINAKGGSYSIASTIILIDRASVPRKVDLRLTPLSTTTKLAPTLRANSRLSLISRHLDSKNGDNRFAGLTINTPFSAERLARKENTIEEEVSSSSSETPTTTMSNQEPHPTLLIPGPIEFDDAVLHSMSHYSESHVGPAFVSTFSEVLKMLRKIFQTTDPTSQPFVISGSGTLGWDMVAANLVEPGDEVLVLHSGYFGDSFADCFETYGVKATQLKATLGSRPELSEVESALQKQQYKLVTITHVDTSTGVLSDVEALSALVHRVSPDTLVVVDGVCSVGSEELHFDDWGLDVVLTASQKGLGCPAGLSIVMVSGRAMQRRTLPRSYFASFKNWLPVMQAYEANRPLYFATPSPQLVRALHTSLTQILQRPLAARFEAHRDASRKVKHHVSTRLGLRQLAADPTCQANGMTAFFLPDEVEATQLLPLLARKGVVLAGGLHKEIRTRYARMGHMGASVVDPNRRDIDNALKALEEGLSELGYKR